MAKILGACIAVGLLIIVIYPFGREAYQRFQVARRLDAVMDDRDRAAFQNWNGDAASFAHSLYDRCVLTAASDAAPNCSRYRIGE